MNDEDLLELFLQEGWEGLNTIEGVVTSLRAGPVDQLTNQDALYAALSFSAHRLRGTAGLYGYPQLAALAALTERLTESRPQLSPQHRDQLLDLLELLSLGQRRALNSIGAGQGEGELGLYFAEVGGAQALQALLRAAPGAFAARRPEESAAPAEPQVVVAEPSGLTAELQAFVRQNAEIWSFFAPEVREYLDVLRAELEMKTEADVTRLFRAAHTLKGSAFMVGLPVMGQLAHRLEDLMDAVRERGLPLEGATTDLLLRGTSLLEQMLSKAEAQFPAGETGPEDTLLPDLRTLESQIQTLLSDEPAPERGTGDREETGHGQATLDPLGPTSGLTPSTSQSIRVSTERLDRLMDGVGQLVMSRARLDSQMERLARIEESLNSSHARVQRVVRDFEEKYLNPDMLRSAQAEGTRAEQESAGDHLHGSLNETFQDLELDSYDDMNILARSVTEMSADLGEIRRQLNTGHTALRDEAATFSKLLRTLRADVARTRRVTLEQAYSRPRRWAGNQPHAELVMLGGDLEVDAFLTQGLAEVLLHLVTNAFTHAQESPDERARSGKPARGRVTVAARQNGPLLQLSVSDDGRGISVEKIREQALARGLRSARELTELNDDDTLRLILLPGLSTAQQVTSEAGRGVGMDIVASTVRRMGGEFQISTRLGQGTTFTLRVPLTQQVVQLLTVQVGPHRLGFPTANIAALHSVQTSEVQGDGAERRLPDGTPLYLLQPLWNTPVPQVELSVVRLKTGSGEVAFGVDQFGNIAEAVIAPPGSCLEPLGYVSGTTVAANGTPVLIPDAAGLIRLIQGGTASTGVPRTHGPTELLPAKSLLLVDDSLSVRRAVSRMLERAGYRVVTANDGLEALELLRGGLRVEAVLTDLEMPRANGFEVIEEVRRRYPDLPVVVMTTRSGEKHQRVAFQLGASDYFSKPVDEVLLIRCLGRLLEESQAGSTTVEAGGVQTS